MLSERIGAPVAKVVTHGASHGGQRSDDPTLDIREFLDIFRRRRGIILATAALPILAALAYAILATPLYTATTQILIDPRDKHIVKNDLTPDGMAPDGGVTQVESQARVLTSDNVLNRVIAGEHLDTDPEFGGRRTSGLGHMVRTYLARFGIKADLAVDPQLKALRLLKTRVAVKRSDKAFVVDVYVTSEEREKSARLADALAQAYLADQSEARAEVARRASQSLGARLDDLRTKVKSAEDAVVAYKQAHNIIGASGVLVTEQQLTEANTQLAATRTKRAEARSRVDQIEAALRSGAEPGAIPEAVQSLTVGQLRVQYAQAARQRAELSSRLGPRHPDVQTQDSQVKALKELIGDELRRIAAAARSELARAEANERVQEQRLEQLKSKSVDTSQAFVRLRELNREVEASRAVYEAYLVRARETSEQESIDTTNARIISTATPPKDASWPPRAILIAVACLAGLGLGTATGLTREYFDETVHSRRQLEGITSVPTLAVMPQLRRGSGRRSDIETLSTPHFAAASRSLRESLVNAGRPNDGRSVLVTSAVAAEQKTLVALNLALVAAAAGERVLLVDADFERGTLSRVLGTHGGWGLFNLLEGRTTLPTVVLSDDETGLNFVPLGEPTRLGIRRPKPETISRRLLEPARRYDLVVVDCGSALNDGYIRPFAETLDDIVLLVRAGSTRKDEVRLAMDMLRANAPKLRGTVLTGAAAEHGG
jgi:uncharacterized protein involved in exopolysaccharide biosynthesis/Mrp family chromosome partitioning ATPase